MEHDLREAEQIVSPSIMCPYGRAREYILVVWCLYQFEMSIKRTVLTLICRLSEWKWKPGASLQTDQGCS